MANTDDLGLNHFSLSMSFSFFGGGIICQLSGPALKVSFVLDHLPTLKVKSWPTPTNRRLKRSPLLWILIWSRGVPRVKRKLNDRVAAVTENRWEPRVYTKVRHIVIHLAYKVFTAQVTVPGNVLWQKVWFSTSVQSPSPQPSARQLLKCVHKSIKLVDVLLIHRQFLWKGVLQTQKTKCYSNVSFNADFNKQKILPSHQPLIGSWCPTWGWLVVGDSETLCRKCQDPLAKGHPSKKLVATETKCLTLKKDLSFFGV